MAIPFDSLRGIYKRYDTDRIVSVYDDMGVLRFEDKPCHLTIKQNDNPATSTTDGAALIPVVVYGELYSGLDISIFDGDVVTVEKRDSKGEVIATYKGKAGRQTARQSRRVSVMQITSIVRPDPPIPPEPEEIPVSIFIPKAPGSYDYVPGFKVKLVQRNESYLDSAGGVISDIVDYMVFSDGWILESDGVYCPTESTLGFNYRVNGNERVKINATGVVYILQTTPEFIDNSWMSKYKLFNS